MKTRLLSNMYDFECRLFRSVNRHFDQKILNFYFRNITHLGGAIITITVCLCLMFFTKGNVQTTSIASGLSLLLSHLPVAMVKKLYPRKRPYIALVETKVPANPLEDHSFPSGHTTAIFSVIIPFILFMPQFALILLPVAISVGLSRMYLGLHYPSDVLAGCLLGSSAGFVSYTICHEILYKGLL
ncbi:phosphatase PAP2 family protein [Metabacillus litoralis]|uniref:phosphatase PAP2 family protein n=1 Tax=Metabacillus TaxID=2675233 RepID=UPI000EF5D8AA|nr:phosphatase PAP2 family protein [Metabacillus litoralis]MCM3164577.1 phosphatase PAP2 family protein [Metabacillus litoralis]MCM3410913.1 phosphatase PAP2 family protein [Metabacillus litoralis]UHA62140.1 phosphatase PAP2 family protein [Metabacillus litoralis]